jgi:aspartate carbamoyltransferase catalytic subunit
MIARNIISIDDLTKDEILEILDNAKKLDLMEDEKKSEYLKNKIVSTMFFEASTRTKLSFESAAQKLGAQILPFDSIASSLSKGESFLDTVRMLESYADILVIRHPNDGAARLATEVSVCKQVFLRRNLEQTVSTRHQHTPINMRKCSLPL